MRHAIVRKPTPNFGNGLTTSNLGAPNYELALQQHQAYCEALQMCGLALTHLEPNERHPDATFVEDTAVLFKGCAVVTVPGAASRVGEVETVAPALTRFFTYIEWIQVPGTIDGGDVCEADDQYFVGISERTNEAGAVQLKKLLASFGYGCTFVDIRGVADILHLKSGLAYLGDNRLSVVDSLAARDEFRRYELIRVNAGEEYAANCIRINDSILMAKGYPQFAATLAGLGYKTIQLEITEFQKMDGGLSCLSLRF
jgi:dimethylargininase